MKNYSQLASELVNSILSDIVPVLLKNAFNAEINYTPCSVEFINNDFGTIWVKWGVYDCEFINLPITAMTTIADNILNAVEQP